MSVVIANALYCFAGEGQETCSIYTLSNLIGSLSLANEHYSPPTE